LTEFVVALEDFTSGEFWVAQNVEYAETWLKENSVQSQT
jgi:hypothetical protein